MSDRHQQILDAAREVVAEEGVEALSVRNVAAKAAIGASTLRWYFPTQRDLYDEVVGQTFHAQLDDLRIADNTVPPSRRLTECMQQFLPADDSRIPELFGWFAGYSAALGPDHTEQTAQLLATLSRASYERVGQWLARLESEGVLRHTDLQRHAVTLLALIDGLCLELLTPESSLTVTDARAVLAEVISGVVVT